MNEYSPPNLLAFLMLDNFLISDMSFIEFWSRESAAVIVLYFDIYAYFELTLTPNLSACSILRLCLKANLFL